MKILKDVDVYRVCEPMFEGIRVIMNHIGEPYSPAYIQGVSGAAFRVATGCPSRPTCCFMMWTPSLFDLLGYEYTEHPCYGPNQENIIDSMITAVREEIDRGRPVLVWHAMTNAEWDVVCGYDEEKKIFYGRGSCAGLKPDTYHTEAWDRAAKAVEICPAFGAVTIGAKVKEFDSRQAEIAALKDAVKHAHTIKYKPEEGGWYSYEGLQALKEWAKSYSNPGKERDLADAYCFSIYNTTHGTAAAFLREIAGNYPAAKDLLLEAAAYMDEEATAFKSCAPYLGWSSPWGVDEERSKAVAPLLAKTAEYYEKAIDTIEKALEIMS